MIIIAQHITKDVKPGQIKCECIQNNKRASELGKCIIDKVTPLVKK